MISMDKKYVTRLDKMPVRILDTNFNSADDYPVVAVVVTKHGECLQRFTSEGGFQKATPKHNLDLIEVKPEVTKWLNIYPGGFGCYKYNTKEDADYNASHLRIACIPITYREGDGL